MLLSSLLAASVLALLQAPLGARAQATTRYCANAATCFSVTPSANGQSLKIAITGVKGKYTALGWGGNGMTNSDIVAAWYGPNQTPVVSDRFSTGFSEPAVDASQAGVTIVPSESQLYANNSWIVTFTRAAKAAVATTDRDWPTSTSAEFIYAVGVVADSASPSAVMTQHTADKSRFSASNLVASAPTPPGTTPTPSASPAASAKPGRFCVPPTGTTKACFTIAKQSDTVARIGFEVSDPNIWVALGIGSGMADADIAVSWLAPAGSSSMFVVSDRYSSGYNLPSASETNDLTLVPSLSVASGSSWTVYFDRPLLAKDKTNDKDLDVTAGNSFIWAYGPAPSTANDKDTFSVHTNKGTFKTNFFTGGVPTLPPAADAASLSAMNIAHAVLMFIAWGVFCPVAIAVARYFHNSGAWWFQVHRALFFLVLAMTIIAFALAVARRTSLGVPHFYDAHGIIGLILFILSILQSALGIVIDKVYNAERKSVPWWDMLHWWAGRLSMFAAIVVMSLGATWYSPLSLRTDVSYGSAVAYWVWICLVIAAFIGYEVYFRRTSGAKKDKEASQQVTPVQPVELNPLDTK